MSLHVENQNQIVYKRKSGKYSSHEIILDSISGVGSILDLGASDGILYKELTARGFEVTCVDYVSKDQVANIPSQNYIFCNLENFEDLKIDKKFDYIILADVLEHLRNASDLLEYIKRFLKDDGEIIISVPNIAIWVYRLSLLFGFFDYTEKGTLDDTHVRFYTKKTFLSLVNQSKFEINKFVPTSVPFEVVLKNSSVAPLLESIYFIFAKFWPSMFAYQFVIRAKKNK